MQLGGLEYFIGGIAGNKAVKGSDRITHLSFQRAQHSESFQFLLQWT
jgi:hypothetical protein